MAVRQDLFDIVQLIKNHTGETNVSIGYPLKFEDREICVFSSTPFGNYENELKKRNLNVYIYSKTYDVGDEILQKLEAIDISYEDDDADRQVGSTDFYEFSSVDMQRGKVNEGVVKNEEGLFYEFVITYKLEYKPI